MAPGRNHHARSRGQALVEAALVLPIVLVLILLIFDFGRVIYAWNAITQDAREAARVAAVAAQDKTITGSTCDPNNPPVSPSTYCRIRVAAVQMSPGVTLGAASITGAGAACAAPLPLDQAASGTCFYPQGSLQGRQIVVNVSVDVPLISGSAIAGLVTMITGKPPAGCFVSGSCSITARSISYVQ